MKSTEQEHRCIVCGKSLPLIVGDPKYFHPMDGCIDGNVIVVKGGYGSEVFDPIGSSYYLAGAICNDCLKERMGRLYLMSSSHNPDLVVDNLYE